VKGKPESAGPCSALIARKRLDDEPLPAVTRIGGGSSLVARCYTWCGRPGSRGPGDLSGESVFCRPVRGAIMGPVGGLKLR